MIQFFDISRKSDFANIFQLSETQLTNRSKAKLELICKPTNVVSPTGHCLAARIHFIHLYQNRACQGENRLQRWHTSQDPKGIRDFKI